MENNAGRRMRKRITAPRNLQEAHQLITKIKQEFGLVDAEDSYDAAMSAQQAMYAETLHQYVKCAAWAAMQAAGVKTLVIPNDVFTLARRVPVNAAVGADKSVRFELLPEGVKTDDEILADAKLAEMDDELARMTAASFGDAAGDENYALEADRDDTIN